MAGSPWTQIQSVISMVVRHAQQQNTPPPMCVVYAQTASIAATTAVLSYSPSGSTNFKAAFQAIQEYIKTCQAKSIVITFMTDGQETVNKPHEIESAVQQLKFFLNNCGKQTTVHAIGYTSSHDINLLQKLKSVGTREGMYRYAESRGLEEKFLEVFEWVDTVEEITVTVNGNNITCQGEIQNNRIEVECWLPKSSGEISQVTVTIGKIKHTLDVAVIPPNPLFTMAALGHLPITTQQELSSIQERINKIKVFGNGMTREERQMLMTMKGEIQERLDAYHQIMAELARTSTSNVAAVAKLQDLKYAHQFSKASRKRRMDQRAAKNQGDMSQIDDRLSSLTIPSNAFHGVNVDEFTCFLTQSNVQEMMNDSKDDVMGFGLLIERTEFIVDAPSMITIRAISRTIISKSACEDAIRHKIHVDGEDGSQAHGGFVTTHWQNTASQQQDSSDKTQISQQSLPRFTIGTSGEAINAFLPLYICESHAQRVMVLIKPLLGYFFALDPLGYKEDQYLAMFTILGHLLQRAHSERDEWILLEYKKMCRMVMPEAKKYLGYDLVEHFIASLGGRVKGSVGCQNIVTIVGWAYTLIPDDNTFPSFLTQLRYPLLEEMIRRSCDNMFHAAPRSLVDQHIRELLYGTVKEEKQEEKIQNEDPLISAVASLSVKPKEKMDEKYATWAKYKTGYKSHAVSQPKDENLEDEVKLATPQPTSLVIMEMNAMIHDKIQAIMTGVTDSWKKYISKALLRINITPFDITEDALILRPMLIQCLKLTTNDAVNQAITNNTYVDVRMDTERVLINMHDSYQQQLNLQHNNIIEHIRSLTVARHMMITDNIWSFVGRLMSTCPTRGGMVWDALLALCMDQTRSKNHSGYCWPLLEYKIRILFTGTLVNTKTEKEYNVLAQGQAWFADKRTCDRFHEILGDDAYLKLELAMRGRVCSHVYRISDIPNRHGHCNSNPYFGLVRTWGESK